MNSKNLELMTNRIHRYLPTLQRGVYNKMRTLKFRLIKNGKIVGYELWHDGKWTYADSINTNFNLYTPFIKHDDKNQFIGLFDKSGKEIYEGDVVSNGKENYLVDWNDIGFRVSIENDKFNQRVTMPSGFWVSKYMEVIGNIHESPELLKDGV